MEMGLLIAMDKYAMFAVTCSHVFLDKYIDIIKAENDVWASHSERGIVYMRELKLLDDSTRLADYELVILQPEHFLPDNSVLPFYNRRQSDGKVVEVKGFKMVDRRPRAS